MTKESLQKKCNEKGLKLKILFVEKTEFDDYEVVYTFDLNYQGRDSYEQILEPELDELIKDEEEFFFMVMEKYWCENCCNFDKEKIDMGGLALCKITNTFTYVQECGKDCKFFNVPAADVVEVVHAYWDKDPVTGVKLCSNCKAPPPGDAELDKFYESDYCPCCGAKMDGKINPSAPTG